ncbi:hypothetical protein KCU57_17940 [Xanthomonas translucens]|uniref:hypothetical protein n=1 Tax=Xanthomonas campestris pv. translucens TaxID=343 RepID=UPI001F3EA1C4|nr:hypothetical protein [Xanthomonas translucens]UKE50523.1 hypothetical protein KCU57_17940 [Xanthomonas translucens]
MIVHGQIPGDWNSSASLSDTAHNADVLEKAIKHFERCVSLISDMYLCVLAGEIWGYVSTDLKKEITAGMSAETRQALLLDKG